jgi:hypothetical protein
MFRFACLQLLKAGLLCTRYVVSALEDFNQCGAQACR